MIGDFTDKYYELPEDEEVVNYIANGPISLFQYVQANEITNACEKKKTKKLSEKCYQLFLEFE